MKMWSSRIFLFLFLTPLVVGLTLQQPAYAAKKKKKNKDTAVDPANVFEASFEVSVKGKKKKNNSTRSVSVDCNGEVAGQAKGSGENMKWQSFSSLMKKARKSQRKANTAGKKKKLAKRVRELRSMRSKGNRACVEGFAERNGDNETPGGDPAEPSVLDPYTGTFGEEQARILYDRFAFGGTPEEIGQAVAAGLGATIDKLTTYSPDAAIEADVADVKCDTYLKREDHRNERECEAQDPNDFSSAGLRQTFYLRALGPNAFHAKMMYFLADERLAPSIAGAGSCTRNMADRYMQTLLSTAITGDYFEYMKQSTFGFPAYILNITSSTAFSPNEDFARELLELGTTGVEDVDGNPNYGPLDIANLALALTGLKLVTDEFELPNGDEVCESGISESPTLRAPGVKTIFLGQASQVDIEDAEDALNATFNHPSTAQDLARDLCAEFIKPNCSKATIREIAGWVREANYNLLTVMKRIMSSSEIYAESNRKSLIKHPMELLLGFLRRLGYTRIEPRSIDFYLSSLSNRFGLPPTIFGFYHIQLAGERYVNEKRNLASRLLNRSEEDIAEDGLDLAWRFHSSLPSDREPSRAVISRAASYMNVRLNAAQEESLNTYLNFNYAECQEWQIDRGDCSTLGETFLDRDVYDTFGNESVWKLRRLLSILWSMPEFQTK